jgi:hypothetical protein
MNIWTWVPGVLTIDQNQQRIDDSEQCLAIFNRNPGLFENSVGSEQTVGVV